MAEQAADIRVQVCFAHPDRQILRDLTVPAGSTVQDAIDRSGVLRDVPQIDPALCRVGIYGKLKTLDATLRDRDRVEIYRALIADPKESRRRRAEKKDDKKVR